MKIFFTAFRRLEAKAVFSNLRFLYPVKPGFCLKIWPDFMADFTIAYINKEYQHLPWQGKMGSV
jgi:hypothetical protein